MSKHYNLYYLLKEDQKNNPMSEEAKARIRKQTETFFRENKPPWKESTTDPPKKHSE